MTPQEEIKRAVHAILGFALIDNGKHPQEFLIVRTLAKRLEQLMFVENNDPPLDLFSDVTTDQLHLLIPIIVLGSIKLITINQQPTEANELN